MLSEFNNDFCIQFGYHTSVGNAGIYVEIYYPISFKSVYSVYRVSGLQTGGNDNLWTNYCVGYRSKTVSSFGYYQETPGYVAEVVWIAIGKV